jgi:hypothetical protein
LSCPWSASMGLLAYGSLWCQAAGDQLIEKERVDRYLVGHH